MADFNFDLVDNIEFANNTIRQIKVSRDNDRPISLEDIIRINNDIQERYNNDDVEVDTLIRAETSLNSFFTIKGYRDDEISFDEDYFEGRVKDLSKFSYATTLFISIKLTSD